MTDLFRNAVVEQRNMPYGQLVHWSPPRFRGLIATLLGCAVVIVGLVLSLPYSWKVPVHGLTQSAFAPISVRTFTTSLVEEMFVQVGDQVEKGQTLATLSSQNFDHNGILKSEHELLDLRTQLVEVEREQRRTRHVRDLMRRNLVVQLESQKLKIEIALRNGEVLADLVEVAKSTLDKHRHLFARRLTSEVEASTAEQRWLEARAAVNEHQARTATLDQEANRLGRAVDLQAAESAVQEVQFAAQQRMLKRRIAVAEGSNGRIAVAPRAGVVGDVAAETGSYVVAGSRLVSINPDSDEAYVELWLNSRARGRVSTGQSVSLRIAGYPQQEFGLAVGRVTQISSVGSSEGSTEPTFRARVILESLPQGINFLPTGMSVEGDIEVETMRIWRWLLRPISDLLARS